MQRTGASLAVAAGLLLLFTGSALADDDERGASNASLRGKFRFNLNKTCTDSFNQSLVHTHFIGVTTYDGNGGATVTERGTLFLPATNTFLTFEETAVLTYQVKRNGTFTQEGTFTATDGSYTLTGAKLVGQIDAQGSVLALSAATPPVLETLSDLGGPFTQRSCGGLGTAVRIR